MASLEEYNLCLMSDKSTHLVDGSKTDLILIFLTWGIIHNISIPPHDYKCY